MNEGENNNVVNGTVPENNGTTNNEAANNAGTQQQIVIEQPGKVRKALKWVFGALAVVVSGVGGYLFGKSSANGGDGPAALDDGNNGNPLDTNEA